MPSNCPKQKPKPSRFTPTCCSICSSTISIIRAIHECSADTLKYLAAYPDAFRLKALTADYIVRRHNLTADNKLVQDLFAFDDKVTANENRLFSQHDLIFGNNEFDQAVKQRIMQAA